jgi:hypothetical protein
MCQLLKLHLHNIHNRLLIQILVGSWVESLGMTGMTVGRMVGRMGSWVGRKEGRMVMKLVVLKQKQMPLPIVCHLNF